MANIVEIQFTAFQNLDNSGAHVGESHLGYRIFDDYDADYNNTFDSIDAMKAAGLTPEGIFEYIDQKHKSNLRLVIIVLRSKLQMRLGNWDMRLFGKIGIKFLINI